MSAVPSGRGRSIIPTNQLCDVFKLEEQKPVE